ncbi:MAG: TolC family protein [Steroidobacteraceae bacterium]
MRPLLALAVALVFAPVAFADDLLQVFDRALLNDPQIREADANRLANRESKPQALAALLPQLNGSASISKNDNASFNQSGQLIGGQLVTFGGDSRSKPDSRSWSINLTQSVFSWADWVALRQANKRVAQAEADYQAAQQDLVQRVATRYFDVLAAQDSVTAQQAALEAFTQLLDQADKRFEVGLIAITDVQEARAARDTSAAALIAAKRQLSTAEQFLQEIVGIASGPLAAPAESMPLKTPNPADADAWVNLSMSQNLALTSSRLAADIARDNVRSAFGGHLPQLDLVASRGNNHSESTQVFVGGVTAPSLNDQDSKSVGLVSSSCSPAAARSRACVSRSISGRRRAPVSNVPPALPSGWLAMPTSACNPKSRASNALRPGSESARTALQATEAGYEVGTRTAVGGSTHAAVSCRRRLTTRAVVTTTF